jgi:hypothetical protein
MKNIATVASHDDKESYKKIVKGTRKPQKPYLLSEQAIVEVALDEYATNISSGTAAPLGFSDETRDYHYSLYDSGSIAVVSLKDKLAADYSGAACPYCQLDTVSHIDHFLPRAHFPEFSVSLQNLLMSCDICNSKFKKEKWGNGAAQEVINPRYNALPNNIYLESTVIYTSNSLVVGFFIRPGLPISQLLQRHFALMNLNKRYIEKVTLNEVPKMKNMLASESTQPAKLARLTGFVSDQITVNNANSWERAFYTAVNPLIPQIAVGGL